MSDDDFQDLPLAPVPSPASPEAVQALSVGAPKYGPQQTTAAQAKIDAVASLTMKAYDKAGSLALTADESAKLQADFPDEAFKPGAAGKENLIYIEHPFLRDRFIEVFGMGGWAMVPRNRWAEPFRTQKGVDGQRIYVEAMLVVRGCFVAEAIGEMEYYPSNGSQNYGDATEGAETAAFRRCAKKFGVGLQAWKKDWCEGWWKRKHAPKAPAPKPQPIVNAPAQVIAKAAIGVATPAYRERMIKSLNAAPGQPARNIVTEYLRASAMLLPNEEVEELALRWVPVSKEELNLLSGRIAEFEQGDEANSPFLPHDLSDKPYPPKDVPPLLKLKMPRDPKPVGDGSDVGAVHEPWYQFIVPVPRKGQKRDAYLQSPDTIGSLFDARHGTDEDAAEARRRLFGFVNNYEAKGWQKSNGQQMPPSQTDVQFRSMLDLFADWFAKNHPDEKL